MKTAAEVESDITIVRKRVASLKPSPENEKLYRPTSQDQDIATLAASIEKYGLHEMLTVTEDCYIVSGHRRHAALVRNKQQFVKCKVLPFRRDSMSKDDYILLLRSHNHQRAKTVAEQVREQLVDIDPDNAARRLFGVI